MKPKTLLLTALLGVAIASTASAEISIVGTASGSYDSSSLSASVSYTLQGAGNTLVFGTYVDTNYTPSNVQFAGASAAGTVSNQRASLFYFYNPASTGSVTFSLTAGNVNSAYYIFELSGVDTTAAVSTGTLSSITTTAANQFIVNFLGANNTDGSTLATAGIQTLSGVANANGAIGGGSVGASFATSATVGAAGTKTMGWTGLGGGFAQGEVSLGLTATPVPEPSTYAIFIASFCGVVLLLRRRKA